MNTIVELARARSHRQPSFATADSVLEELVFTLAQMGWSGHRDAVVRAIADQIASAQAIDREALERLVVTTFEAHCAGSKDEAHADPSKFFYLPFGPGSLRWALHYDAAERLAKRVETLPLPFRRRARVPAE